MFNNSKEKAFWDYSSSEQAKALNNARTYYRYHINHINELVQNSKSACPPSGSDLLHPELWKDIHWVWYFNVILAKG